LKQRDPSLSVVVLEAEQIGYGASGRFQGWLSAKEVGARKVYARNSSREAMRQFEQQLVRAMDEVVDILGANEIRADRGGWLKLARSASEQARLDAYLAECRAMAWTTGR
jgi:glycine/D-amino acid oxidase-like deaminating enzyme